MSQKPPNNYDSIDPPKHTQLLEQAEVNKLPEGTKVIVTWEGGNGPHEYTLGHYQGGPVAWDDNGERRMLIGHLMFVGLESYRQHVSVAKNDSTTQGDA